MKTRKHFEIPISILEKRLETMRQVDKRRVNKGVFTDSIKQIENAIVELQRAEEKK